MLYFFDEKTIIDSWTERQQQVRQLSGWQGVDQQTIFHNL